MTRRAVLAAVVVALVAPGSVRAGEFAVGVANGASLARVRAAIAPARVIIPGRALVVRRATARGLASLPGVGFVERLDRTRRLAFDPTDPLAPRQWYLAQDRAYDFWVVRPKLATVRVAVIDSGIDGKHPEFLGRVVAWKSFVGGTALEDVQGHGTFIAGEIAAATDNDVGIAGLAFSAQLVVAKVVRPDGTVPLLAEVQAIRWAVDQGARVVNLSLGGVRDPLNEKLDTYSPLEQAAVEYAYSKGAVVVAAVGNGPQSPATPWSYAHYPAALPHVLGVSAYLENGSVPAFSNRDAIYNDISAPGRAIFSTLPFAVTAERPSCANQGYSDCGPREFRLARGTSFAAPQVAAAAALLLGENPALRPEQVTTLLERSALDATADNGCAACPAHRDAYTGWGKLDVTAALEAASGTLPQPDGYESNDDAGPWAHPLYGSTRTIDATLDYWDDQIDVYKIRLDAGQRLFARLRGPALVEARLVLWKPGTTGVEGLRVPLAFRAAQSTRVDAQQRLTYRAPLSGFYFLELKASHPGAGAYRLSYAKS